MADKEKHTRIEYTSENGYKGVLYGKSSFVIYDSAGRMVLHTGVRNIHTYDELVKQVDSYPEFRKLLLDVKDKEVIKNE